MLLRTLCHGFPASQLLSTRMMCQAKHPRSVESTSHDLYILLLPLLLHSFSSLLPPIITFSPVSSLLQESNVKARPTVTLGGSFHPALHSQIVISPIRALRFFLCPFPAVNYLPSIYLTFLIRYQSLYLKVFFGSLLVSSNLSHHLHLSNTKHLDCFISR